MKKIVFVGLIALLFGGCGKIEKGSITIENKSTHEVDIEFAQNYSSEFIKLQSGDSISRSWERYFHCIIQKPSTNILKRQQTKEKITIFNNDDLYKVKVCNFLDCPVTLQDNQEYIFADEASKNWIPEITIDAKKLNHFIYLFRKLVKSNIIIKETSQKLIYDNIEYTYEIKKMKDIYCLEKTWETEDSSHVKTKHLELHKINIDFQTIFPEKKEEKEEYIIIISAA